MSVVVISLAIVVGLIIGVLISPRRKKTSIVSGETHLQELEKVEDISKADVSDIQQELQTQIKDLEKRIEGLISDSDRLKRDLKAKASEITALQSPDYIKTLRRQLADAEEELEDAESSIKKLKKQLEEKVSENVTLMDNLSVANRSINELNESFELTRKELEFVSGQFQSVSISLVFMQEILAADPITDETLDEKDKKINALCDFVSFDLQDFYKQYFKPTELSNYIFGSGLSQWAVVKRKSWIEGKKTIAFIGEFSAGKTSIVNRILSQDDSDAPLLPVSAKATTAIPTYIAGGDVASYQFYSPDGSLKGISEDAFKKVNKEILGNIEGVARLIRYFVMTYQNPHLEGMSILDTPGFSSGDEADAVRTIDVINECDALFWVFDVNAGTVNRSSLEVIKSGMTRPLYVVINKIDTKATSEVDAVEQVIRKAFEDEGIKVEGYIRFSPKTPIEELMDVIAQIEKDSSAEKYLSKLTDEFIASLIEKCEMEDQIATRELAVSNHACDEKWTYIARLCQTIQRDSIDAASIPHWETHLLTRNRYEMDKREGERLISLLGKVAHEDIVKLIVEIGKYGELMLENQTTYSKKSKEDYKLQQLLEQKGKLNRLIADLKR